MLELGFEYSTISTHRSAISCFYKPIEGFSVRKHPKVWNLMAGVYKKRSPKPRYRLVWDIETVMRYLRSLPINKLLSTKMLTLKLTMLLALMSTSRSSQIRHLDIRFYIKSERKFCLHCLGGFVKFLYMLVQTLQCLSHNLLGQLLLQKPKLGILPAKFSKRLSGPKNQHGKSSIIKRYFQKQPLFNRYWHFEQRTKEACFWRHEL